MESGNKAGTGLYFLLYQFDMFVINNIYVLIHLYMYLPT